MKHEKITAPRRRDEVLAFIIQWIVRNGSSPTMDEIADAFPFGKSRAKELVEQLVKLRILMKTPGAQRNLRVVDVTHAREILVMALRELGGTTANPMGTLEQPCPTMHLPPVLKIRHLPDE